MINLATNAIKKFLATHNLLSGKKYGFVSGGRHYKSGLRVTFEKSLPFLKGNKALDLGAGFGNETKVLLEKEFDVVAVDSNPAAIQYLKKLSRKNQRLTVVSERVPHLTVKGKFDVVVCEMVLHFLNENDAIAAINQIQNYTKPGGINVVSVYIDSPSIKQDPRMDGYCKHLFKSTKIQEFYKDWEMIDFAVKKNMIGHESARFIARKADQRT